MSDATRAAEADRVELVYYWALNQLGNAMALDAIEEWKQVPATKQAAKSAGWLARILKLLFGFRSEGHDLAVAYYRLVRALRTGHTVATGNEKDGDTVSLEQLRLDFEHIVDHIDAETSADGVPNNDEPNFPHVHDDGPIIVENLGDIDKLINDSNDAALQEAAEDIDLAGIENLIKKLGDINPNDPRFEQLIAEAHASAGYAQAAEAMRIMLNAARGLVFDLADIDRRVIGWVRYSQTGHPCGWCAMLISRGVVYKSQASALASKNKDGNRNISTYGVVADCDKYHTNCHCVAIPVFFIEQFDNSTLFALNHELDALWQDLRDMDDSELIKLYGSADTLVIFRKIMRQRRAQADAQTTTAPEAA